MTRETAAAEPAAQVREAGPEHARLAVFLGRWRTEGEQHAGPIGPAAKIAAVETYEWLAGGLFLVHRFDGRVGEDEAACIEVIGYDPSTGSYPTQTFYNNGQTNHWKLRAQGDVWVLTGDWRMGARPLKVRCLIEFGDAGRRRTGRWESSTDGATWRPFWTVTSTKT